MTMLRTYAFALLLLTLPDIASAEETFVTIQKVSGNQLLVVKDDAADGGGRGRGRRGGEATNTNALTVTVPTTAKITSAMRERRTFEFRVLGEIPGGLRSSVFQRMNEPLKARIVTKDNRITEVNVISGDTDMNQSATSSSGQTILAVKPKRPPMKKK